MMEIVDPAMLQEAADDAADMDVLADARHLGFQAADAADDQIDPDAGLAGFVQFHDDAFIGQGIHFRNDMPIPELFMRGDFVIDVLDEGITDFEWGHVQMIVLRLIGIAAQVVEEVSGILADFLIGGEDGHIGIKSGCLIVIIAGSRWT